MSILILDHGVGNLASIAASLRKVGATPKIVSSVVSKDPASGLVLPGVGSYSAAFKRIDEERGRIKGLVEDGFPILGICLGLQLMFNGSEEGKPDEEGLGLFKGSVKKIPVKRLPHMGWNSLEIVRESTILKGLESGVYVYFANSYAPMEYDPGEVVAFTSYGDFRFPVVFEEGNVFGVQFHPEKSGKAGLRMLENFVNLCRGC